MRKVSLSLADGIELNAAKNGTILDIRAKLFWRVDWAFHFRKASQMLGFRHMKRIAVSHANPAGQQLHLTADPTILADWKVQLAELQGLN